MATQITAKCTFTKHGVKVCYPPQVIGGSGISGNGDVDYVTSIKTVAGGAGSAIVTIGKSDIYDAAGAATWTKSLAGGASFNFTALDLTSLDYANIYAQSGLTGIGLVWSNTDAGVVQKVTNDSAGLTLSVADKGTSAIQTALVLSYSKVQFYSPDSPLGTAGTLMIDSTGYIYTSAGGGGGITSLNSLTASAQTFTNDANVTIVSAGTSHVITWVGTLADARIASAATWNAKQNALSGTGFVKITGTTISYDNSTYYLASNPSNYIALTALSSTATGLTYTNTTGVFSLTSGYVIPTTTEETNWNTAYTNRITSATSPLSIASNAISISQATTSTNGYLSSTDWNTFNAKGSGSVTSVAWTTSQGVSASIANPSTTPNITITLGALTGITSLNGLVIAANTGTITTGAWNGTLISPTYGGTGVNNGSNTITLAGNLITTGAFNTTFAASATGTYTLPSATSTLLANNLGISGGSTLIGGTAATAGHGITFIGTSFASTSSTTNSFVFKAISTEEILRMGNFGNSELRMWAYGQSGTNDFFVRAGTNYSYINAGTDLRLQVGGTSYINMLSGAGTVAIQKPMTFASGANVTLVAGSTTLAPLVFTSGTYKTTPTAGSMEYNGQFSLTPTDATRRYIVLAASSTKVTASAPYTNDGYVVFNVNGSDIKFMTTA